MKKRIILWDEEDDTTLVVEIGKQYTGVDLYFEGPMTSYYSSLKGRMDYGIVDKKLMYDFCKRIINHLDKERKFI